MVTAAEAVTEADGVGSITSLFDGQTLSAHSQCAARKLIERGSMDALTNGPTPGSISGLRGSRRLSLLQSMTALLHSNDGGANAQVLLTFLQLLQRLAASSSTEHSESTTVRVAVVFGGADDVNPMPVTSASVSSFVLVTFALMTEVVNLHVVVVGPDWVQARFQPLLGGCDDNIIRRVEFVVLPAALVGDATWGAQTSWLSTANVLIVSKLSAPTAQEAAMTWLRAASHAVPTTATMLLTGCWFSHRLPVAFSPQDDDDLNHWAATHADACDAVRAAAVADRDGPWRVTLQHARVLMLSARGAPALPIVAPQSHSLVVTLAVHPARIRLPYFQQVVRAVADAQSVRPDRVVINLPDVFSRTGECYVPPAWLFKTSSVLVHFCGADAGPVTKLLPTVRLYESSPQTRLVVVDDDREMWPHTLELFLRWSGCLPDGVIGNWGIPAQSADPRPVPDDTLGLRNSHVYVADSVLGVAAYMLRARHADATHLANVPTNASFCRTHDDLWISYGFDARRVPMFVVPGYPCAEWEMNYDASSDANGLHGQPGQTDRYHQCADFVRRAGGNDYARTLASTLRHPWSNGVSMFTLSSV